MDKRSLGGKGTSRGQIEVRSPKATLDLLRSGSSLEGIGPEERRAVEVPES